MSSAELPKHNCDIRRVAILFAGGPAPAANSVISTAAASFLRHGIQVMGIRHGYSHLLDFTRDQPLQEGRDYVNIQPDLLSRTRNSQGIMIGTSRCNPGKLVNSPADLKVEANVAPLRRVYEALCSIDVDALVSIGGDDTLKTANKFKIFQDTLDSSAKRIPVVHLPKTIDNDYYGIDFTFGYFTAVDFLARELRNLIYDAEAGQAYFVCETMGRSAGWLAYGAAIAGEASLVVSVEDVVGEYAAEEVEQPSDDRPLRKRTVMNVDRVIGRMVKAMLVREEEGKPFGVIVVAEGLAELLPSEYLHGIARDDHGHLSVADVNLSRIFARALSDAYEKKTKRTRKVTGLQLGYEARCAKPHAFDVMLGAQLGVGSFRALVEERLNGVMVSISGQLDLHYVPFDHLVNQETLVTRVRYIEPRSDFHRLARFMETYVNE